MSESQPFDFSNLADAEVKGETLSTFELPVEVRGYLPPGESVRRTVKLVGRFAGETNKPYHAELMREATRGGARAARRRANKLDPKILQRNRERDRKLYPEHVLVEIIDGADASNREITTRDKRIIGAYCAALPSWVWDEVTTHFSEPVNFLPEDAPEPLTAEEIEETGND